MTLHDATTDQLSCKSCLGLLVPCPVVLLKMALVCTKNVTPLLTCHGHSAPTTARALQQCIRWQPALQCQAAWFTLGLFALVAGHRFGACHCFSSLVLDGDRCFVVFCCIALCVVWISFEAAEADCNRALACPDLSQSDRVKALLRRGTARMHKGDLRAARSDFKEVLAAEPNNRQAQEELKVGGCVKPWQQAA